MYEFFFDSSISGATKNLKEITYHQNFQILRNLFHVQVDYFEPVFCRHFEEEFDKKQMNRLQVSSFKDGSFNIFVQMKKCCENVQLLSVTMNEKDGTFYDRI